ISWSTLDPEVMEGYLLQLAGAGARILERVENDPGAKKYRLGLVSKPEVLERFNDSQARLEWSFVEQFERWRVAKKSDNLLRGEQLSKAKDNQAVLISSADASERKTYLDKSLLHQRTWRLGVALLAIVVIAGGYFGYRRVSTLWQQHVLATGELPRALYTHQSQLASLYIDHSTVHDLKWLRPAELSSLSIKSTNWNSLRGLAVAHKLNTLMLDMGGGGSQIDSLAEVTGLTALKNLTLFIGGSKIRDLKDIATMDQLENLTVSMGDSPVDFSALARLTHLQTLTLDFQGSYGGNLASLHQLSNIQDLTLILDFSFIQQLPDLQTLTSLKHLSISAKASQIRNLESIKALRSLQSLAVSLEDSPSIKDLPDLSGLSKLECLELNLVHTNIKRLPTGIAALKGLKRLSLDLRNTHVKELPQLDSLPTLENLSLDLTSSEVKNLPPLQKPRHGLERVELKTGSFGPSEAERLNELESLHELELDLTSAKNDTVPTLKGIRSLSRVTAALKWSQLQSLYLPGLTDLTLTISDRLPDRGLEQLSRLAQTPGLVNLALILEYSPINSLPDFGSSNQLTSLRIVLGHSHIADLGNITQLSQIQKLDMDLQWCRELSRLPELGGLTKLQELRLKTGQSGIQELTTITRATHLLILWLDLKDDSQIKSLPDLSKLTQLKDASLDLRGSSIKDLAETQKLAHVTKLTLTRESANLANLPPSVSTLKLGGLSEEQPDKCK
ncbi:MAG TPA: hypothetical protein VG759_26170, partial [Candidatus Angelobacter sp.]|nr:hypothetical protein [Candidatus Angelobacter sp.]